MTALDIPDSSKYDHRIKYTKFNTDDIVQLETVIGGVTHIILEEGEQYITHAFDNSKAYTFAIQSRHIFIKLQAKQANLIIVTDGRSYKFRLVFRGYWTKETYERGFTYTNNLLRIPKG